MKSIKRIFSIFLAVLMCFCIMPVTDLGMEVSAGKTLTELRQKFPNGKYWNHAGNPGSSNSVNNQDGYTSTPCSKHGVVGTSAQTCNGFAPSGSQLSWQCMGYAEKLGYDATGYNPRNNANGWSTSSSSSALNSLKPGDIVRYKNDGHSIYVIGVNGETVTYTDCNSDGHCVIRWDATISKSTLKSTFTYVRSAPYAITGGSTSVTHTRNTNYGTDFSATANEKIDVFNADHSDPGNYYIDAGDKCTIHEVYTDGCCRVTYPSSASSTGTRTYYAPFSKFTVASSGSNPVGAVDSVWGGTGFVHVSGWAFDPDNGNEQLNIHVYIGDEGHGWISANKERTDVHNVHGCGNYHGFNEDIKTSKTGTQTVEIYAINVGGGGNVLLHSTTVNITPNPKYDFDVNMMINGSEYKSGYSGFTFDLYLNGSRVADDTADYATSSMESGTNFEIKDIKCPTGYTFTGGTTSGVVSGHTDIRLNFSQNLGVLDLNGMLDGSEHGSLSDYGTADIYINGTLYSNRADFCETLPAGTKYEIKNIKASTGKSYNGVYSGSLSGTIMGGVTTKVLLNFSRTGYSLYFDVNHDNIRTNLYKPTKSTKTINGVTYKYNASKDKMILNGSLTASGGTIDSFEFKPSANSYYKLTAKLLSGSFTNSIFVIEARNSSGGAVGSRIYFDVYGNSSKTWYFSSADANSTAIIHTWLYSSNESNSKISNAEIQIKIEKVTSSTASATEFSPSMKGMHYNEAYPTTMTPTRTGYNFDGWYTAATGGTKITSSSKYPASNQTLYAHWSCKHSTTELRNVKAATCSAEGYTGDTYCKTCGTKTKSGTAVAKLTHSYTSTITTGPTCTQAGVKTFICSKCGDKYTETIAKKGHTEVTVTGKAATCTATGLTDGKKCSVCGTVTVAQQTIAKKGHTEVAVTGKAATCTATGLTDGKKCSVCGTVTVAQKTIAKKAHTEVVDKAVSATCTKTGLTEGKHCSVCNTVIVAQTVVPVKNHSYSSWKQTKAPTCTSAGEKQRSCSSCGKVEKQSVATIDHTYTTEIIEPTCSENGVRIYICSECRYSYNEDIPATGHADKNSDGACDDCSEVMADKSEKCSCMCHKSGFMGFIWKILRIFYKLFKANPVCNCGVKHY